MIEEERQDINRHPEGVIQDVRRRQSRFMRAAERRRSAAQARSAADYLNTPEAAGLDGTACGEALVALGEIQAKLAAAHMEFLRRFDAADAHDADGYGTASAWLAAKTRISRKDARAKVRDMRRLTQRPLLRAALAAGDISKSWAATIEEWTRKLPEAMREETDKILLQAIAAAPTKMTWRRSPGWPSRSGASSGLTKTTKTASMTASCGSAPRSPEPA